MKIQNWDCSEVKPYEFNNRNHSDQQIQRIAKSIKEFGFNQPIVVDENGVVLVGHGRLLAAIHLKLKEVPVVVLKDLPETKKRAYRILDNKLQNDSTWAFNNLELELGALEDEGFDLPEWGLDTLKSMFGEVTPEEFDETITNDLAKTATFKITVEAQEADHFESSLEEFLEQFNTAKLVRA